MSATGHPLGKSNTHATAALAICMLFWQSHPEQIVLEEDFSDLEAWTDVSTRTPWGGHGSGESAFSLGRVSSKQAVCLSGESMAHVGYADDSLLKSFTCLDHVFSEPVDHQSETLQIAFDAQWKEIGANTGEKGRILVILMDDYPSKGISDTAWNHLEGNPFGTPALHLRIRPNDNIMPSLLQYGGGHGGEFEKYRDKWWLPGFIQNALPEHCDGSCTDYAGTCPECDGSPGRTPATQWPNGSWQPTTRALGSTSWQRYRYVVEPRKQLVYEDDELVGTMELPDSMPTAPGYENYDRFKALRIYWSGHINAFIANLTITRTGAPATRNKHSLGHAACPDGTDRTQAVFCTPAARHATQAGTWYDLRGKAIRPAQIHRYRLYIRHTE